MYRVVGSGANYGFNLFIQCQCLTLVLCFCNEDRLDVFHD